MRQTPGRLHLLTRRPSELASILGRGGGEFGDYWLSIGGECNKDGWVKIWVVAPLSQWFSSGFSSSLASSVGFILLGWVKSSMGD